MSAPLPPLPFEAGDEKIIRSVVREDTWLSVDLDVGEDAPEDAVAITVGLEGQGWDVIVSRRELLAALGVTL